MSDYIISEIHPNDTTNIEALTALLKKEGIDRDANLDYTCVMYDDDYNIIATGSCFRNTLRCIAVSSDHQGESLLNQLITHLISIQFSRDNSHFFLYTKSGSAKFFQDLGFYEIAGVDGVLSFMENKKTGFSNYLKSMLDSKKEGISGAVVMNANPFTLGHLHLIERASGECDQLHLFLVSEDTSIVPFEVRKKLVLEGIAHIPNIIFHESGPYIISNATFPSYFLKDKTTVSESHARLDIEIFKRIAGELNITKRFVGEEPLSEVTSIYNTVMISELPTCGIDCIVIPRKETENRKIISATTVRTLIKEGDFDGLKSFVLESTLNFFKSNEALPVINRIKE